MSIAATYEGVLSTDIFGRPRVPRSAHDALKRLREHPNLQPKTAEEKVKATPEGTKKSTVAKALSRLARSIVGREDNQRQLDDRLGRMYLALDKQFVRIERILEKKTSGGGGGISAGGLLGGVRRAASVIDRKAGYAITAGVAASAINNFTGDDASAGADLGGNAVKGALAGGLFGWRGAAVGAVAGAGYAAVRRYGDKDKMKAALESGQRKASDIYQTVKTESSNLWGKASEGVKTVSASMAGGLDQIASFSRNMRENLTSKLQGLSIEGVKNGAASLITNLVEGLTKKLEDAFKRTMNAISGAADVKPGPGDSASPGGGRVGGSGPGSSNSPFGNMTGLRRGANEIGPKFQGDVSTGGVYNRSGGSSQGPHSPSAGSNGATGATGFTKKPMPTLNGFTKDPTGSTNLEGSSRITDKNGRVKSTAETALPAEARGILDTIAGTESPDYNTRFGGAKFSDLSKHPNLSQRIERGPNAGRGSTAAGRYQFLYGTWNEARDRYNKAHPNDKITDFSPQSQDKVAWHHAQHVYRRQTGRDLSADLKSNDPEVRKRIGTALRGEWTSLPGGIEQAGGNNTDRFLSTLDKNIQRNKGYEEASRSKVTDIKPKVGTSAGVGADMFAGPTIPNGIGRYKDAWERDPSRAGGFSAPGGQFKTGPGVNVPGYFANQYRRDMWNQFGRDKVDSQDKFDLERQETYRSNLAGATMARVYDPATGQYRAPDGSPYGGLRGSVTSKDYFGRGITPDNGRTTDKVEAATKYSLEEQETQRVNLRDSTFAWGYDIRTGRYSDARGPNAPGAPYGAIRSQSAGFGLNLDQGGAVARQPSLGRVTPENAPEVKSPSVKAPESSEESGATATGTNASEDKGPGFGDIPTRTKDAKLWMLNRADVA